MTSARSYIKTRDGQSSRSFARALKLICLRLKTKMRGWTLAFLLGVIVVVASAYDYDSRNGDYGQQRPSYIRHDYRERGINSGNRRGRTFSSYGINSPSYMSAPSSGSNRARGGGGHRNSKFAEDDDDDNKTPWEDWAPSKTDCKKCKFSIEVYRIIFDDDTTVFEKLRDAIPVSAQRRKPRGRRAKQKTACFQALCLYAKQLADKKPHHMALMAHAHGVTCDAEDQKNSQAEIDRAIQLIKENKGRPSAEICEDACGGKSHGDGKSHGRKPHGGSKPHSGGKPHGGDDDDSDEMTLVGSNFSRDY